MAARREAEHRVLGEHSLAGLEPAEAQALERLVERELELAPPARLVARIALGRKPEPYLPQKPTPGEPEPVAPAHPHEVLDRRALELRGGCGGAGPPARRPRRPSQTGRPPRPRRRPPGPLLRSPPGNTRPPPSPLSSPLPPRPPRSGILFGFPLLRTAWYQSSTRLAL